MKSIYFWCALPVLSMAWTGRLAGQALWLDTIPAQSLACLTGSGSADHELTGDDLAALSRAAVDSGLQALGYPFVRSLARTGQNDQTQLAWEVCAPVPAGTVVRGNLHLVSTPPSPGAFHFCPGSVSSVAKTCVEDLLRWVDPGKPSERLVRSLPLLPAETGDLPAAVARLLTDTAAVRVDSHGLTFPQELDATPVDELLQGKTKAPRPLFTTGRAFAPLAGEAILQRGLAVFVAIASDERDALTRSLAAPKP